MKVFTYTASIILDLKVSRNSCPWWHFGTWSSMMREARLYNLFRAITRKASIWELYPEQVSSSSIIQGFCSFPVSPHSCIYLQVLKLRYLHIFFTVSDCYPKFWKADDATIYKTHIEIWRLVDRPWARLSSMANLFLAWVLLWLHASRKNGCLDIAH